MRLAELKKKGRRWFTRTTSLVAAVAMMFGSFSILPSAPAHAAQSLTVAFTSATSSVSETAGTHAVTVALSATTTEAVTVDVGIARSQARNHARCSAQDFSVETTRLSFAVGEKSKTISLTLFNDTVYEADEELDLLLLNPAGISLGATTTHTVTITDNDRPRLVSVLDYGAEGDGVTEDQAAIQSAIDDVYGDGGGVIVFPPGEYLIGDAVTLKPNITYVGYGARTLRLPNQDMWELTFRTYHFDQYVGASEPLVIQGFEMDGNRENQGAYQDFELQQQHLLFLTGGENDPDRLHAFVEDMRFVDGVADAISVWYNANVKVCHVEVENVFRGGFVMAGGNSSSTVYDLTTEGDVDPGGIDIEIDAVGANSNWNTDIRFDRLRLYDGDFDYSLWNASTTIDSSSFVVNDTVSKGSFIFLYPRAAEVSITDSELWVGVPPCCGGNNIYQPVDTTFDHTTFYLTEARKVHGDEFTGEATTTFASLDVIWQDGASPTQYANQQLTCNNCAFLVDSNVEAGDTAYVVRTSGTSSSSDVTFNGGSFSGSYDSTVGPTCETCTISTSTGDGTTPGRRVVNWERDAKWFGGDYPTASVVAYPTSLYQGQSATLTWSSGNADSCTATGFATSNATSGAITVSPTTTTQYDLTCITDTDVATSSVTVPVVGAPQGPVAQWTFEEGTGSVAGDVANNNDGSISGASWTSGISGSALSFDTSNDIVTVPNHSSLNIGTSDFTVTAWVSRSATGTYDGIYSSRDSFGVNNAFHVLINDSNKISLNMADGSSDQWVTFDDALITDDDWHHIAVVVDRDTAAYAYVDGVLKGSGSAITSASGTLTHTSDHFIGRSSTHYFGGKLDDVRVYRRALGASEVDGVYLEGGILFAHWKMDDGSGATSTDSIATYHGTLSGGGAWTSGREAGALSFDGVNDYVTISDADRWDFAGKDRTITLWAKASTTIGNDAFVLDHYDGGSPGQGWHMLVRTDNKKMQFEHTASSDPLNLQTPNAVNDNEWHFYAWTLDGSIGQLFMDGTLVATDTYASLIDRDQSLIVGGQGSFGGSYLFKGAIDDVRMYSKVLSETEIDDLYEDAGLLVSRWKFDDASGATSTDSGVGGYDASVSGATWTSGQVGGALSFDGSDDLVTVPSSSPLLDMGTGDFTVSAWVKRGDLSNANKGIYSTEASYGTNSSYSILYLDKKPTVNFLDDTGGGWTELGSAVNDTNWHLLTMVFDRDQGVYAYLDGALYASSSDIVSRDGTVTNSHGYKYIGRTAGHYFKGLIDDMRVYNYALTAQDVADLYENTN